MADQEDLLDTKLVKKGDEVSDDVESCVRGRGGWGVGVTIAAKVGGDAAIAVGGEVEKLVSPRVPELREAMEEEDHWAFPYRRHVHVYAICGDSCVLYFLHV